MTKKILSISAALLAMATITLTSCGNDDDDNPTPATNNNYNTLIVGKWRTMDQGADVNNNGTLDAGETATIDTSFQVVYSEFFSNNTARAYGTFFGMPIDTVYGTWQIVGSNYLRTYSSDDTGSLMIYQLNTSTMVLRDTAETPDQWIRYTKQ